MTELLSPMRHATDRVAFMGRLRDLADAAVDVVAPQRRLVLRGEGPHPRWGLLLDEGDRTWSQFDTTPAARIDVATRLAIPVRYWERIYAEHPILAADTVTTLTRADDRVALYRFLRDGDGWVLRAQLSDRYSAFDNWTVLQAVQRGLEGNGHDLADAEISVDLTPERFRMRLALPSVSLLVPELLADYRGPRGQGDAPPVLWAGLEVSNSETGNGAFKVVPRIVVLICRNGLTRNIDAVTQVHLGGRLDAGVVEWSNETRRLNADLLASKVSDAVTAFASVEYLRRSAEQMRAAKGIPAGLPDIEEVRVAHTLTEEETQAVMDAFLRGGDATRFGLGQAVTAVAQEAEESDRQAELEAAFWQVVGA